MTTIHDLAGERDVIVVGAGFGGLYALHRLRQDGLSVIGFEAADGVGGVWRHNRYPGARVDIDSFDYCYYFSPELYRDWEWSERYASQPELLRYLDHVADRFDLRRLIRFETRVTGARWRPELARWEVTTSAGEAWRARFLVMATGNLSEAREPDFPGLHDFRGEWVQTSHWPDRQVEHAGKRVAVIGTGSSGVQCIPVLAEQAARLTVFQRTPNYSVPARNGPIDAEFVASIRSRVLAERDALWNGGGTHMRGFGGGAAGAGDRRPAADYTPEQQQALLKAQWMAGGHGMTFVFSDQGVNPAANALVSDFVRAKIRGLVDDPEVAEALCPYDHPIGTRRLVLDTGYYATFNRPNVDLVDLRRDAIERITPAGVRLASGREVELDLIVFALGFHAFTGAIERANIRNAAGAGPTDGWKRGPRTMLGLMTSGFPNLFLLAGPGSPATLSNLVMMNEYHVDWLAGLIAHMRRGGFTTVEPTGEAEAEWTAHVAEVAAPLLRLTVRNYMVHRNEDGSAVFIPFAGGLGRYRKRADAVAAAGYAGFAMQRVGAPLPAGEAPAAAGA